VTITVIGQNDAPTGIALSNATVAENAGGAIVGSLTVTDPDAGDSHAFEVSDDRFEVLGGELKLKDGISLDHETEPSLDLTVTATDQGGMAFAGAFTVITYMAEPEVVATVSFAVMSDRGAALADGIVEFDTETLVSSPHIQHQELLTIVGDGDRIGEAGEIGHKLSDMGYGGRVTSLTSENASPDPVVITGHGKINNNTWGDLTPAVRFANDRGFGLDNGPDGEGAAKFINGGDSLTFDVGDSGTLGRVVFTVNAQNALTGADVKLAADGDIVTSGAKKAGGGLDDFALDLGRLQHGSQVVIDFGAREVSYTQVDGQDVTLANDQVASFIEEFRDAGADQITIGSRAGEGFAIQDLQLEVWSDLLVL
jgi:hypothetical protein